MEMMGEMQKCVLCDKPIGNETCHTTVIQRMFGVTLLATHWQCYEELKKSKTFTSA